MLKTYHEYLAAGTLPRASCASNRGIREDFAILRVTMNMFSVST